MPFISNPVPPTGILTGLVATAPGWKVDAYAPRGIDISGVPTPSHVVAWVLVADELEVGGSSVQPVFVAAGRTWTPEQFRSAYGSALDLKVVPA